MDETWIDRQEAEAKERERTHPFHNMCFPKRFWDDNKTSRYKVYRSPQDYEVVEALTAAKAVEESGVEHPLKVERFIYEYELEVDDEKLTDAVDVYERPVLDVITEDNPVISNEMLTGLIDASEELDANELPKVPDEAKSDVATDIPTADGEEETDLDALTDNGNGEPMESHPVEREEDAAMGVTEDPPSSDAVEVADDQDVKETAETEAGQEAEADTAGQADSVGQADELAPPSLKDIISG